MISKCTLLFLVFLNYSELYGNIYITFYATNNGNTGHIGIAVDNYDIKIFDYYKNDMLYIREDSICNGTITYFDLWPKEAIHDIWKIHKKYEAFYSKYPTSDFDDPLFLEDLVFKGIPRKKNRKPDGLLKINSTAKQDFILKQAVDSLIALNKQYQAINYNCTDFIADIISMFYGQKLSIQKEKILFTKFSTPNKLFSFLQKQNGSQIIINPENKLKGSFLIERFFKRLFYRNKNIDEKIAPIT